MSALTLILFIPSGLFIHPIEAVHDAAFDDVLAQLLQLHGETLDAAQRAAFRCLDFDAGEWLPMPRRLALIRQRRLAVMHPDVVREHGGDTATPFSTDAARLHSARLRESVDVIPKVNTAIAVLRRDLRDLLAMQSEYLNAHGRYAVSLEELEFLPAPGNHLELIAGKGGFAAAGRSDAAGSVYGVRAGDGAGHYADKPEGEVFLDRLGS